MIPVIPVFPLLGLPLTALSATKKKCQVEIKHLVSETALMPAKNSSTSTIRQIEAPYFALPL